MTCCTGRRLAAAHLPVVVVGLAGPLVREWILLQVVPRILCSQAAAQLNGGGQTTMECSGLTKMLIESPAAGAQRQDRGRP